MGDYSRMHLFQKYGIELEYMIVDSETLDVKPIADQLLFDMTGDYSGDYENGNITWSNELVLHVIELKCTAPTNDLVKMNEELQENINQINELLKKYNAKLMSTAAHPWMNPQKDTFLWPHGNFDVYKKYDQMFGCHGHGWSNLQSTHINLPFYDDEEFSRLHTAIRVVLPLIPAIAASTPILESRDTGYHDMRMVYYAKNQQRIQSITGRVIPGVIHSKRQYHKLIYDVIKKDVAPFDPEEILNPIWVNSRGAIARFDRGSIEIRIMDIQECPKADLAITTAIILFTKMLSEEKLSSFDKQQSLKTDVLVDLLNASIKLSGDAKITNNEYLNVLGIPSDSSLNASEVWNRLLVKMKEFYPVDINPWMPTLKRLLNRGTLASQLLHVANGEFSVNNLKLIYQEICENLNSNELFKANEAVSSGNHL